MIKMIVGKKGAGKTKTIIALANEAVAEDKGMVVVIERGEKLRFDISHKARLINSKEYEIASYERLLGFISGVAAGNYDITSIFMDSMYKIAKNEDPAALDAFVGELERLSALSSITFVMTVSDDESSIGENGKPHVISH